MSVHRFYQKSPVAECRSRVIVVFLIEYQVVPHLHACEMQAGNQSGLSIDAVVVDNTLAPDADGTVNTARSCRRIRA